MTREVVIGVGDVPRDAAGLGFGGFVGFLGAKIRRLGC